MKQLLEKHGLRIHDRNDCMDYNKLSISEMNRAIGLLFALKELRYCVSISRYTGDFNYLVGESEHQPTFYTVKITREY